MRYKRPFICLLLACMLLFQNTPAQKIPVEYHKLKNGLKVVLSKDNTVPLVAVGVYYHIGFRIEPRNRTGFAHLFEHMMFQGSQNLGKMEFIKLIQSKGGELNGSTRFDFTNYYEVVPSNYLETALWAEADRMRGLAITEENLENQKGVVTNEVKVNVLNQPYGGFPWLDLPQAANENWYNAHNFYGELGDLQAANLEDVKNFFKTFYSPNNAALVISGDFESKEALKFVEEYFGNIPMAELPAKPDLREPRQEKEKIKSRVDSLATKPAMAFAYHMPEKKTPEYYAMGILDQILLQGDDSKLYQSFVQKKGITSGISGGINGLLGNMYNYEGPMLWSASFIHDGNLKTEELLKLLDEQIEPLTKELIDSKTLQRALVKLRSAFYAEQEYFSGFGKADLLASYALFDDDPSYVNKIEDEFKKITPELIRKTAQEYLRPSNRTVVTLETKSNSK